VLNGLGDGKTGAKLVHGDNGMEDRR